MGNGCDLTDYCAIEYDEPNAVARGQAGKCEREARINRVIELRRRKPFLGTPFFGVRERPSGGCDPVRSGLCDFPRGDVYERSDAPGAQSPANRCDVARLRSHSRAGCRIRDHRPASASAARRAPQAHAGDRAPPHVGIARSRAVRARRCRSKTRHIASAIRAVTVRGRRPFPRFAGPEPSAESCSEASAAPPLRPEDPANAVRATGDPEAPRP